MMSTEPNAGRQMARDDDQWAQAYANAAERLYGKRAGDTLTDSQDDACIGEASREAAAGVQAFRCPCCGDDVFGVRPICDECTLAGCEQTRDASGELNYWDCQTER